jgi:hypothetical protein
VVSFSTAALSKVELAFYDGREINVTAPRRYSGMPPCVPSPKNWLRIFEKEYYSGRNP